VLNKNDVVEIILNNLDTGKHPFHLHGHNFQVISRSLDGSGPYNASNTTQTVFPKTPMRRDTFLVRPLSNFVIRFRADNPGIWLFHCHIEWHTASGLIATFIEAPLDLQNVITLPQNHLQACQAQGIATKGNAAGNTVDLFDLTGENVSPPPLPAGFTAKGIVALVFSCLSAVLGVAVISWYGMLPITSQVVNGKKQAAMVEANAVAATGSKEDADKAVEQTVTAPKD
jgi:iron transport multicopper oxidase